MDKKTKRQLEEAVNEIALHGGPTAAARATGIARTTLIDRATRAKALGIEATKWHPELEARITEMRVAHDQEVAELKRKIKALAETRMTTKDIRNKIFALSDREAAPPDWTIDITSNGKGPGVPTLMLSDWHWGEVVRPEMVDGVNEYNLEIASQRFKSCIERTIDLCSNHMVKPKYPGIVVALGGDMISGDIHEELRNTNDGPLMSHVFDLFDHLVWGLDTLANHFGKVFVPCTYGNHGRNTDKPIYKEPAETNFDWLLYNMLERHYKNDRRVTFMVPLGFDSYFRIYNTHYVLTHGDRLGASGGKGVIGVVGPIVRGAGNIVADYAARNRHVDYVIMGHWHQYMKPPGVVVNGAGKGFDEFAKGHRFKPEPPVQALWFTHPKHGITFECPVFLDEHEAADEPAWVMVDK